MIFTTRNRNFVGRANQLHELSMKIRESTRSFTAISGLGGLGYDGISYSGYHD